MIWVAMVIGLSSFFSYIFGVFQGVKIIEEKNRNFALDHERMCGKKPEGWTYFTDLSEFTKVP